MSESSCIEDPSFSLSLLLSVSVVALLTVFLVRCTHTVAQV